MLEYSKSLRLFFCVILAVTATAVCAQSTESKLRVSTNVAGTGTAGKIVKWLDANGTLTDSIMTETSGGQIGVGSPAAISNKLHIFTTGNADGLSVDGTQNPAVVLRNNGTVSGYLGLATAATAFFSNGQTGDVVLRSETGNVLLGRSGLAAALVVNGSNVGIGTNQPKANLHLYSDAAADATLGLGPDPSYSGGTGGPALNVGYGGGSFGRGAGFINVRPDASAVAPNPSLRFLTQNLERMIITRDGAVGIGTSSPGGILTSTQESLLHIYTTADKGSFLLMQNASNTANAAAVLGVFGDTSRLSIASHSTSRNLSRWGVTLGGWTEIINWAGNGMAVGTTGAFPLIIGTNSIARLTIDGSGTMTVGSTTAPVNSVFHGTLQADRVIGAVYQDVAEWVPATEKMMPGTVVVLDRNHKNTVKPSARAYDTTVAGVVSEQPGIILGAADDSKAQIATTGRVKVHVDASDGAVEIGDLLVTSNKPGTAMKSQPVDLGGVPIHRPGTVIGKALEPLASGEGEILVLLSLQ